MEAASRSALDPLNDELEPKPQSASDAASSGGSTPPAVSMESLMGWTDLANRAIVEPPPLTDSLIAAEALADAQTAKELLETSSAVSKALAELDQQLAAIEASASLLEPSEPEKKPKPPHLEVTVPGISQANPLASLVLMGVPTGAGSATSGRYAKLSAPSETPSHSASADKPASSVANSDELGRSNERESAPLPTQANEPDDLPLAPLPLELAESLEASAAVSTASEPMNASSSTTSSLASNPAATSDAPSELPAEAAQSGSGGTSASRTASSEATSSEALDSTLSGARSPRGAHEAASLSTKSERAGTSQRTRSSANSDSSRSAPTHSARAAAPPGAASAIAPANAAAADSLANSARAPAPFGIGSAPELASASSKGTTAATSASSARVSAAHATQLSQGRPAAPVPSLYPAAPSQVPQAATVDRSVAPPSVMDRDFIARNQIVERYLSGKLPIKGATDFERFCHEHPDLLDEIGLPQRVHAGLRLLEASGKPEPWHEAKKPFWEKPALVLSLAAIVLLLGGVALFLGDQISAKNQQLAKLQRALVEQPLEAAGATRTIRVLPSRTGSSNTPVVSIGGSSAQLADLRIDLSRSPFRSFRVTIDRIDQGRVAVLHNISKDSNGHVRIALNSSALGPGNYAFSIDGLTWRGETVPDAWVTIGIQR
jgi:hypothetical protein